MIYLKAMNGKRMIVLGGVDLERFEKGKPVQTPDDEVLLVYVPDLDWLGERVHELVGPDGEIDADQLSRVMEEGQRRPEIAPTTRGTKYMYLRGSGQA